MKISRSWALGLSLLLAACGKPDASGIYVAKTDSRVTLVQLVQAQDGKLTGRLEESTIGVDGTVTTKEAMVDGSVSGNELMLRPASAWFGGIQASGTISGSKLTLTNKSDTLTADRSSLEEYQEAVAKLKGNAAEQQQKVAETNAALQQEEARIQGERETAATVASIREAASLVANAATRLNNGISKSPDFAKLASANTARVSRMLAAAPNMSEVQRGQLGVQANQVIVGTNQIDVAREQYALRLNDVVNEAKDAAGPIAKHCGQKPAPQFAAACQEAFAAMNDFKAAVGRGQSSFSPYKQRVADEIQQQEQLAAKID